MKEKIMETVNFSSEFFIAKPLLLKFEKETKTS